MRFWKKSDVFFEFFLYPELDLGENPFFQSLESDGRQAHAGDFAV
ncbi:hypothetical protein M2101_002229 [Parabacteroides sp. PM5-20]|nr:hypothetical protein [Parabacteroides sp. PM5-20]